MSFLRRPFFVKTALAGLFPTSRHRFWALFVFLVLFTFISTSALMKIQSRFHDEPAAPPPDPMVESIDLHTLVSGSLILSGLHTEEILREEGVERRSGERSWQEYRTDILVGEEFPFTGWIEGLRASVERAGARLVSAKDPVEVTVEIFAPAGESAEEILVETLTIRFRPSPEALTAGLKTDRPRVALVVDDLGQNPAHFRRLTALGLPLTISVLPNRPHSLKIARGAASKDMEILLHLPMEPVDFPEKRPGPGALFMAMSQEELQEQLTENLDSVPGVSGVNNHMGSRLTADSRKMETLMEELKARNLFFLDSKTSPHSLAFDTAFRFNLPTAQRDIFLDAHDDEEFIRGQIDKLLALARRKGSAIGIGHPYESTLAVLEEMAEELRASEIEWVHVSALLVQGYRQEGEKISSLDRGEEGPPEADDIQERTHSRN